MTLQRQPLPRRGSSQISDLDVQIDPESPPTPVLEGKHMLRREKPLDVEKCQEKTATSEKNEDETQKCPLLEDGYFGKGTSSEEKDDAVQISNMYHALQIALWIVIWIAGSAVFLIVGTLPTELLEKHEAVVSSAFPAAGIVMVIALHQVMVLTIRAFMWRVSRPITRTSHAWLCCYNILPPVFAIVMAVWFGCLLYVSSLA